MKKEKVLRNQLWISFFAGIILVGFTLLSIILYFLSEPFVGVVPNTLYSLAILIVSIVFLFGFILIADRKKSVYLKVGTVISMFSVLAFFIAQILKYVNISVETWYSYLFLPSIIAGIISSFVMGLALLGFEHDYDSLALVAGFASLIDGIFNSFMFAGFLPTNILSMSYFLTTAIIIVVYLSLIVIIKKEIDYAA